MTGKTPTSILQVTISKASFFFIDFLHLTNQDFVLLYSRIGRIIPILLKQSDTSKHTSSIANFNRKSQAVQNKIYTLRKLVSSQIVLA